jgi:transposase
MRGIEIESASVLALMGALTQTRVSRDRELVRFVGVHGAVAMEHVMAALGVGRTAAYRRVALCIEGGLLERLDLLRDEPSLLRATRAGVHYAGLGLGPAISGVVFTDPDTVREVIHNFNGDGFDALYPRYAAGRPPTFTLPQRREIKKIALSIPTDLGRPFATWSLAKLADYLVAEGVVTDISHEGLRQLLREEGVSFQAVRTWKRSQRPQLRGQEEPHPGAIRGSRRRRGDGHLPG